MWMKEVLTFQWTSFSPVFKTRMCVTSEREGNLGIQRSLSGKVYPPSHHQTLVTIPGIHPRKVNIHLSSSCRIGLR